jgi:hypothetical protein
MSVSVDLSTKSGTLYSIPLDSLAIWWGGLVARNEQSRRRDEEVGPPVVIDLCPTCDADPVHFTLVYGRCTQRVCRKCDTVLEELRWPL